MSREQHLFHPDDPKYICCCGCHIMTGAKILAGLQSFGIIMSIVCIAVLLTSEHRIHDYETLVIALVILCFLFVILLNVSFWYGLIKEREGFLTPTIIVMAIGLVLSGIGVVFQASTLSKVMNVPLSMVSTVIFIYVIMFMLSFGLQFWFYSIVKSARSYIKHKRLSAASGTVVVQQMKHVYVAVPEDDSAPPPYNQVVN